MLEDIAILTGGQVINEDLGIKLEDEKTAASTSGGWSHSGKTCFAEAAPTRACHRTPSPPP
jgi:chaperonin GroEL (HSP60 family)